jgi:hypothetical protein
MQISCPVPSQTHFSPPRPPPHPPPPPHQGFLHFPYPYIRITEAIVVRYSTVGLLSIRSESLCYKEKHITVFTRRKLS